MARFLARIGGALTWVGADDAIDVGIVKHGLSGVVEIGDELVVEWIGRRTWNELAGDARMLVTSGQKPGELLEVWCSDQPEDLPDEVDAPLSSREAALILDVLEQSGRGELAARIAPILDRCTKTDPPPAGPDRAAEKPA